jgi:hypothetical protein
MFKPRNTFNVAMIQLKPSIKKFYSSKSRRKKNKGSLKRTSSVLWNMINNYNKHDDLAYKMYNDMSKKLYIYSFENLVKKIEAIKSSEINFILDNDTNTLTNVSTGNILTTDSSAKVKKDDVLKNESDNEKVQSFLDIDYLKNIVHIPKDEILESDLEQQTEDELEYQVLDDEIHNESDVLKLSDEKYSELFDIDDEISWMPYIFSGQWFTDAVNSIDLKLLTSLKVFYEVFSGQYDLYTLYSAYKVYTSSVDWETFFAREIRAAKVTAAEIGLFILLLIIKNLSSILKKTPETDIISMTGKFILPVSLIANAVTTPFSLDTSMISSTNPSQLSDVMPSQIMIPNPNNKEVADMMKNFEKVQPLYIKSLSNGFPHQNVELEELKNQLIKLGQSKETPLVYTPNENSLVNFKQQNFIENYHKMLPSNLPYGSHKRFKKINLDELNKGTRPLALLPEKIKVPEPEIAENVPTTKNNFGNIKRMTKQTPHGETPNTIFTNPSGMNKSNNPGLNFSELKSYSSEIEIFPNNIPEPDNMEQVPSTTKNKFVNINRKQLQKPVVEIPNTISFTNPSGMNKSNNPGLNFSELKSYSSEIEIFPNNIPEPDNMEHVPITKNKFANINRKQLQKPVVEIPKTISFDNSKKSISNIPGTSFSEIKSVTTEIENFPKNNIPIENSDSIKDTSLQMTKSNNLEQKEFGLDERIEFHQPARLKGFRHNLTTGLDVIGNRNDRHNYWFNLRMKPIDVGTAVDNANTLKRPFSSLNQARTLNANDIGKTIGFNLSGIPKRNIMAKQIPKTNTNEINIKFEHHKYIDERDKVDIFLKFLRNKDEEIIKPDIFRELFIKRKTNENDFRIFVNKVLKNQFADNKTLFDKNLAFYNDLAQIRNKNMKGEINLSKLVDNKIKFDSNLKPNGFNFESDKEMVYTQKYPWFRALNIADLNMLKELNNEYTPELFEILYENIFNRNTSYEYFRILLHEKISKLINRKIENKK